MRKSIGKVIFWCLLGVLTVVCSANAGLTLAAAPERSAGENRGLVETRWDKPALRAEPATLVVLMMGPLAFMSMRVVRRYRTVLR